MSKFLVNGAIDATSHITIKNGADLYLQAPSSTPDDSGDLVFTKYDGTEQGRIWISGGVGMIRFSSSDTSKTLIHSGNIGSQSVHYATSAGNADTVDSKHFHWSGQSGQPNWLWGGNDGTNMYVYNPSNFSVSYANSAGYSSYLNTVAGNEIRFHNATGLTAGGSLWLGWSWADGNKTVTKDWYIGNFSGGGLANIYASTFNGTLNGNATSATYVKDSYNGSNITITYGKSGQSSTSWLASWNGYELGAIQPSSITAGWASGASYSNSSNALASTGWGNGNFTYLQTSGDFYGNSGWSHYLISNHGSGETYYNYVICLPFWSYPKYKRMSGGSAGSWYNFYTTENVIIQSSTPGAGFYGQIWFKI